MIGKNQNWIISRFGSRRGLFYTYLFRFYYLAGAYRQWKKVNWGAIERLVFVCKGNICRSAFAQVVAESKGLRAVSCGLDTTFGAPANHGAVKAAGVLGFNLSSHSATPILDMSLNENDLLVAMEPWQLHALRKIYGERYNYTLLGLWADPTLPHIQDPYGSSPEYFLKCFNYIDQAVNLLSLNIKPINKTLSYE